MILGALEAGGTKMVCAVGDDQGNLHERMRIPTRTPEETIPEIAAFFAGKGIRALGIGSFGPLDLNAHSPTFGNITTTPKLDWVNVPLRTRLADALRVPVGIDTDVNAAALGEATLGAGKGLHTIVYFTIGTGVGGGLYAEGKLHHGMVHPEMGHILLHPHPMDPAPQGFCPYHMGCLEGLACGEALNRRWGMPSRLLPDDHIAWEIQSDYLAQMCVSAILLLSPERIVLGGGVMNQPNLIERTRTKVLEKLGGYVAHPAITEGIDRYIVRPGLSDNSGAVGALLLAKAALA
ncbi:MAG: ROK family protein [Christensenellales bacterium]|jgi:fructokinase